MQRAQDKIASMQARAGAIDELIASGALTDLNQPVDDIQAQLDKVSATHQVDNEIEAMKAQLAAPAPDALEAAHDGPAAEGVVTDAKVVEAEPAAPAEGSTS
jgi:phage shock protein A